jgi:Holliday junction resolvase RusA-like endonuclease
MTLLDVTIPGDPVGDQRPRVVARNGGTIAYKPAKSTAWAAFAIELFGLAWRPKPPMDEGVTVEVIAVLARPQRLCRKRDPRGRIPALCKPDGDNILKLALDALVKAGVLFDDTRVVRAVVEKHYASLDPVEQPHVELRVSRYGDGGEA